MSQDQNETMKRLNDTLRSEAELSWQRNSYFLVVSSILLLALSQFQEQMAVQIFVSLLGTVLSLAWILIGYRSSKYIQYWKLKIRELEKQVGQPSIYPESIGGFEMRNTVQIVAVAFLLLWLAIFVLAVLPLLPPPTA